MEHVSYNYSELVVVVVVVSGRSIDTCRVILICIRVNLYVRLNSLKYFFIKTGLPTKFGIG